METDRKWVVVRIDGKIAAVSTDYRLLAQIAGRLAKASGPEFADVSAETVGLDEVWKLRRTVRWEDLLLFGTEFQRKVWRKLWELKHDDAREGAGSAGPKLICYSDFAELCQNRAGVRAVAHAVGLNPVSVIIPCHLVVPKETIDRIREIRRKAESTIFKGDDLCLGSILKEPGIDFGNYALGRGLKRVLIYKELFD